MAGTVAVSSSSEEGLVCAWLACLMLAFALVTISQVEVLVILPLMGQPQPPI